MKKVEVLVSCKPSLYYFNYDIKDMSGTKKADKLRSIFAKMLNNPGISKDCFTSYFILTLDTIKTLSCAIDAKIKEIAADYEIHDSNYYFDRTIIRINNESDIVSSNKKLEILQPICFKDLKFDKNNQ